MIVRFRLGNITETRPVHGKLDHHVSAGRKRDGFKQLHVSVEFTKYGNTLFRPGPPALETFFWFVTQSLVQTFNSRGKYTWRTPRASERRAKTVTSACSSRSGEIWRRSRCNIVEWDLTAEPSRAAKPREIQPPRSYSLFFGTRLQNFILAPTQYCQLRRLPQRTSRSVKYKENVKMVLQTSVLSPTRLAATKGQNFKASVRSSVHNLYRLRLVEL